MFRISMANAIASLPKIEELCKPQVVVGAAIICAILPFDLFQLVFMVIGALCYSFIRMPLPHTKFTAKKIPSITKGDVSAHVRGAPWRVATDAANGQRASFQGLRVQPSPEASVRSGRTTRPRPTAQSSVTRTTGKTPTAMPIAPVSFMSEGWEGEVSELLEQLAPKPESAELVQRVAATINAAIRQLFPGVEAVGLAYMDFRCSSAFGVAAPDVEIVIKIAPEVLTRRCGPRASESRSCDVDMNKVHKSAVRTITERLVADAGFKFRRSAFGGPEPKVTLLAPRWDGTDATFPIEISINSATPLRNMTLVNECKRLDSRISGLFMLVRRWSKDRAICHAPKGHLPRFQWNLLVAYFMQVGSPDEGAQLRPLDLSLGRSSHVNEGAAEEEHSSVAKLFKAFLRFYSEDFEWGQEVVSVRLGKRVARTTTNICSGITELDKTVMRASNQIKSKGIIIEDPFDASRDLGDCLTPDSYKRLQEELARGKMLCARNASLADVLELWSPDDGATVAGAHAEIGEE